MKLYYHPASTASRPLTLFAADHRIDMEYELVDLMTGEHLQDEFKQINPAQCVPALEDGQFRLTESAAILKYLADSVGSPTYPLDLRARARINERMDFFNTSISRELGYGFVYPQIFPTHKRPDEHAQRQTLAWARNHVRRWLKVLDEGIIGQSRYVCGDEITLADYFGIAHVTLAEAVRVDFSPWPNVARWIARMKDRQNWASTNDAFYRYIVHPLAKVPFEQL